MTRKLGRKINGGFAIYYGMGSALVSIMCVVATVVWIYKGVTGDPQFSWSGLAIFLVVGIVMGLIGFSLLRVGSEEIEK
ncbi:MAG: hypothetical protein HC811_10595 [Flammeovirgaceae bacterium]|nr:hypothetical protein [Flammeovirgaceae bacterium]